ncbi:hypothetical protein LOTGIDRAFT_174581 [Lottia gigantea]|uniref:Nuclease EXOG, mitochondrial n=1 Tax=Lottia gigantea TaxID=225164 RepID=V4ATR4_LOTGI|nr:hypothetical protein LOTGIDRAFT_174581 [Lottia gigantea]ESO97146.1 hypothetical protein LOTGIDRAFT_174581 [Lottia gigantea]
MSTTFIRGFASGTFASMACVYVYNTRVFKTPSSDNRRLDEELKPRILPADHPMLEDVNKLETQRRILKYGIPDRGQEYYIYDNHVLAYDQAKKIPIWVAEHLNAQNVKGSANRKHSKFKPDPSVNGRFNAENDDYFKSGWSRGHMSPAGNHKFNQEAMNASFFLSNVVPQNFENNSGFWNRFEIYCRNLTKKFTDVRVITGPVFLPDLEEDGPAIVKYPVIGKGQVAVPTHLYKVVLAELDGKPIALGAFVVPNKPIGFDKKLTDFIVPLETLEEKTGVEFLPKLNLSNVKPLCQVDSCHLKTKDEFELHIITRQLNRAENLDQLYKAYSKLEKKNLKPDQYMIELFTKKEMELKEKQLLGEREKKEL